MQHGRRGTQVVHDANVDSEDRGERGQSEDSRFESCENGIEINDTLRFCRDKFVTVTPTHWALRAGSVLSRAYLLARNIR